MVQNKVLVIGYQKASIELFYKSLTNIFNNKLYKVIFWNDILTQKKLIKHPINISKKSDILNFKIFHKVSFIITGTSEVYLERNIWTYCHHYNLNYAAYVDSTINIRERFINSDTFPKLIFVPDESVAEKIKNSFPKKTKNTKIINIGFISHCYLKFITKKTIKSMKDILYVTSDISIFYEAKLIARINKYALKNKKKLYISIHPRENLKKWKHSLKEFVNCNNINQGKLIETSKKVHEIFGVSTMALLDLHIIGKDVFFLDSKHKNLKILPLFKKYGINSFRFNENNLIKIRNKKYIAIPNRNEITKVFKNILDGSNK